MQRNGRKEIVGVYFRLMNMDVQLTIAQFGRILAYPPSMTGFPGMPIVTLK